MDQYIGKTLDGRYEIQECIGTGGMAVVYKARDKRLNRLVAVKILKDELAGDAEFRRRFHDESQAVAMLSHANIVAIYDVSRAGGLDFIVMELVDGMTLKQYMQKRGAPLNWREALHFITQIVRALGHAHSRGIIHRDIKPQNIMVLRDGSIKVTDFGIARVTSAAQSTLTQEALGSVHYISPEQARGSHLDGRSDLYSAGVVLYEMLTGRLPFEGESAVAVAIQHINSIPIPPRDLNPSIPPALEAITLKAMASKAESRYASAEEMLAALEEFRKNPNVIPSNSSLPDEDALMDEPTRSVPLEEIQREEQRARQTRREENRYGDTSRQRVRRPAPRESYYGDEDEEEEEPRRGAPPIIFAVVAILVFTGGVVFFVMHLLGQGTALPEPKQLTVPDLTPYTWEQLQLNTALYEGFTLGQPNYMESADHEEGAVISQDPLPNTVLEVGSEAPVITLTVCTQAEAFPMPDVTNKLGILAQNELRDAGLVPEATYEYSEEVDADYVIRTVPEAGASVRQGDIIRVYISQGEKKEPVTVPNFLNMDRSKLERAVADAQLTMGEISEYPSVEYDAGKVSYQSIAVNKEVEKGTTINFWISLGPETTPTPTPVPEETPVPTETPSAQPTPATTEQPAAPTDPPPADTTAVAIAKTVTVDLAPYSGVESVQIQVVVGATKQIDTPVNTSVGAYQAIVTGTGTQIVEIYVDGDLKESRVVDFTA